MNRTIRLAVLLLGMALFLASCQKAPELTITSSPTVELNVDGSSGTITFSANRAWTVSSSDSWVSVSPSSGEASDKPVTVTVRCNANTTYDDRTATVTIRMEDLSQSVTIKQPANKGVVLPKQVFDLQSDAKSIDVEVQANVQYTVSTSVNWIKQTGTKGLTSKTLTFSIEENKTYDPREGKITITPQEGNAQEQVISVKQAQKDALNVEKTSYDMPYGGGEVEIKVEANVSFDVTPNADWIHYTQTKALSSSTVCLKIDENMTYNSRQGMVEIKQQNGSLKHTITVNQAGQIAVTSIELDKTSLSLKPGEQTQLIATIKPDNATDKTITWNSSDFDIVTVFEEGGYVLANKVGTAVVTAKAGDKTAECVVTVSVPVSRVSINQPRVRMHPDQKFSFLVSVYPDDATDQSVTWVSDHSEIVSVDENGIATAKKNGNATITARVGDIEAKSQVEVYTSVYVGNPVDLGIVMTRENGGSYKLCWADCNLGASSPEEIGDFYAWGETETKLTYTKETYTFSKDRIDLEDDAANVKLGKGWRMPSREEFNALLSVCNWTWTERNGVMGIEIESRSDLVEGDSNRFFLPSTYSFVLNYSTEYNGGYWTSEWAGGEDAYILFMDTRSTPLDYMTKASRYAGYSIRPVLEIEMPFQTPDVVDLGLSVKWASFNVGATKPEQSGMFYAWGETEAKDYYGGDNYVFGMEPNISKYCTDSIYGTVDGLTVLESEDDVASLKLGDGWRIPTNKEWEELMDPHNCEWTYTTNYNYTNINGYIVRSRKEGFTNQQIFIPNHGCKSGNNHSPIIGSYWSSNLRLDKQTDAVGVFINSMSRYSGNAPRYEGHTVRAVYVK